MADAKISSFASHGTPVGADYVASVLASGPTSKKLLLSDARDYFGLVYTAASPTTADVTGVINTLHALDISGLTAARNLVLPATAAVGDRVGVLITVTHTTAGREILIKGDTGDSIIAGNATYTATEWSRIWMAGEMVILRCTVANSTWVIEVDGRIPSMGFLRLSTAAPATEASNVYYYPTVPASGSPGAWTADVDFGNCTDVTTDKIKVRRACNAVVGAWVLCAGALGDQKAFTVQIEKNGTTQILYQKVISSGAQGNAYMPALSQAAVFAAGDYIRFKYRTEEVNMGAAANAVIPYTGMSFVEVLK